MERLFSFLVFIVSFAAVNTKISFKIYELINPINNSTFYIGMTRRQELQFRLNEHISESVLKNPPNKHKCDMIKLIVLSGRTPIIRLIENCEFNTEREIFKREAFWVKSYISNGHHLLNGGHYVFYTKTNNMSTQKHDLIENLKRVITVNNLKKSEVEQRIGFPQNGLSNILSGKKDLPDKWINPITSYIECFDPENQIHPLSGKELAETMGVKTANEVPPPQKEKWVIEVEKFCNENNCSYKDLIEAYKNRLKVGKKETSKMPIIQDLTPANNPTGSNWFENYRSKKLGLGK